MNILIIDDDLGDRRTIRRTLIKNGFQNEIFEAESIADAFQFSDELIDCAIVDHFLPGVNGLESVDFLRKSFPNACIIIVSGRGDDELASSVYKQGADDYIPKRLVNDQVIRQLIINAVERRRLKNQVDNDYNELKQFNSLLEKDFSFQMISMKQMTALLSAALQSEDHEKVEELLAQMEQEGSYVQGLIQSMIQYHSLREIKHPEMKQVRIESILDKLKLTFRDKIDESGAEIDYDVLPMVYGNTPLLIKLFQNLLSNSLLYCKSEPRITITAEEIDRQRVQINYTDNGVGINEELVESIFEPFVRIPFKNKYTGAGLGLSTCRKIMDIHHGSIFCESRIGQGSQFKITLNGHSTNSQ